jgi:adenylylsulfate kinase
MKTPFVLWITGLPASGKSAITAALVEQLQRRGVDPIVLESDTFRKYFTPHSTYSEEDRVLFYRGIVDLAVKFVSHDVPVVIDATGNLRAYRQPARDQMARFAEVFVDCPLEVCQSRDPKGIYRQALDGSATTVPGVQATYEPPIHPEVHIRSDREDPEDAARRILDFLVMNEWIPQRRIQRV